MTATQNVMTNTLGKTVNRRSLVKSIAGFGAAAVVATTLGSARVSAALAQYKTTARVNLRAGAGTNYAVIMVIPAGAIVAYQEKSANGFMQVGYGHNYGWVHRDYLTPTSSTGNPVIVGTAKTTANVNLRNGPSTGNQVVRVVPAGATVQISGTVQNGFRFVIHNSQGGWIANQYLSIGPGDDQSGNYKTTTAAVNLRAEPSLSAKVLTVIPAGSRVQLLHTGANGFGNVNYKGLQGWVYLTYLK